MTKSVFDTRDYKAYLNAVATLKGARSGFKASMARAMDCQPTYISQVLSGGNHLSLEQAESLSRFLKLSEAERSFFFLLIQFARAGTPALRRHFASEIDTALEKRMNLVERLGRQSALGKETQATYYSAWYYSAIHIALTIPELRNLDALIAHFRLPREVVLEVLNFLISVRLARKVGTLYEAGSTFLRLGKDSRNLHRHHTNWRQQAVDSLDRETTRDAHYSAVVSLSEEDAVRLKELIFEMISKTTSLVKESSEEVLYGICLDAFEMRR